MNRSDMHLHVGILYQEATDALLSSLQGSQKNRDALLRDFEKTWLREPEIFSQKISRLIEHLKENQITTLAYICENEDFLNETAYFLHHHAWDHSLKLIPFYWIKNPDHFTIPNLARGIKLHPEIDHYRVSREKIADILKIAQERNLPILCHTGEKSSILPWMQIAKENPKLKIILGHAGSHAGNDSYSAATGQKIWARVQAALHAALECHNIFIELSTLAYEKKAKIIADALREYPHLKDQIFFGSDWPVLHQNPITKSLVGIQHQEDALKKFGVSEETLQHIHSNAEKMISLSSQELESLQPRGLGNILISHGSLIARKPKKIGGWLDLSYTEIASTNLYAAALPPWTIVRAESQTAGRGRYENRKWISSKGGLWFSAVVPVSQDLQKWKILPLSTGCALMEAFEEMGLSDVSLRWPNDLLVCGKKLCGVMIENKPHKAILGIGINVANKLDSSLRGQAIRLCDLLPQTPSLDELIERIAPKIESMQKDIENGDWEIYRQKLNARWSEEKSSIECTLHDGKKIEGVFLGIDKDGNPILESSQRKFIAPASQIQLVRHSPSPQKVR